MQVEAVVQRQLFDAPVVSPLRWSGSKRRLIPTLRRLLPPDYAARRHVEPFVGSAAVFLGLRPSRALLSDADSNLINALLWIRSSAAEVASIVREYGERMDRERYYALREEFNATQYKRDWTRAAMFVALTQSAFGGVVRYNRDGDFNAAYRGERWNVDVVCERILVAGDALRRAVICNADWKEVALKHTKETDFVYMDPPYVPKDWQRYDRLYAGVEFGPDEQRKVREVADELHERGCKVMVSNSEYARELFDGGPWRVHAVNVHRSLNAKAARRAGEIVVTNY